MDKRNRYVPPTEENLQRAFGSEVPPVVTTPPVVQKPTEQKIRRENSLSVKHLKDAEADIEKVEEILAGLNLSEVDLLVLATVRIQLAELRLQVASFVLNPRIRFRRDPNE